jgi:hypothetical protein
MDNKSHRRSFLGALGVGVSGLAASMAYGRQKITPEILESSAESESKATKGYALTDHVRSYYKSTVA